MTIQHRRLDTLRLDPLNPREHSQKQIAQIAESIRAFGFNVPVLIDDDNKIIAGHGRVLADQLLGITEIPSTSDTGTVSQTPDLNGVSSTKPLSGQQ